MRTLYLAITLALLSLTQTANAAKVDAIDDVSLTACLTTRVKFNQEALKPYQAAKLSLKIEDEANEETRVEPITLKDGVFSWEKAIPVSENLKFTILQDDKPISYPFTKETRKQLAKVISPTQVAQAEADESVFVRGLSANSDKKDMNIPIAANLVNKEILVVLVSEDGKSLWQHHGSVDSKVLEAKVPDATYSQPRIVASDTICKQ